MPEINPIIQTLLQLIQAKQEDERLKTQKEDAQAQRQFQMENLKAAIEQNKAEREHQKTLENLQITELREAIANKFREQVAGNLRKVQGIETIPQSIPTYQPSNIIKPQGPRSITLPNGQVIQVEMPRMDVPPEAMAQPPSEFKPFSTQIINGPLGPQPVEDVVNFPEFSQGQNELLKQRISLDVSKAGLISQVQEAAKRPNIEAQIIGRENVANIGAEQREATAAANRESAERIAGIRSAATLEAAKMRAKSAKVSDSSALEDMASSVALGELKLPAGNNGIAVNHILKAQGYKVFEPAKFAKIGGVQELISLADRVEKQIVPLLAKSGLGAMVKNAQVMAGIPTDLRNKINTIRLDALTAAKSKGLVGSLSDRDMQAALDKLADPNTTQKQGLDRVRILRNTIMQDLTNNIFNGIPDRQVIDILTQTNVGIDPSVISVKTPKGILPKYFLEDDGIWHVYNPVKNQYDEVQ